MSGSTPWTYAANQGYQIVQALYAVSSGGVFGAGLGQGLPGYIPEVYTDFVYAAIAEELGLLGALAILVLLLIMVFRGLRIALRCPGPFEQMLALGLACLLGLQCLVIVAGNLEVIPLHRHYLALRQLRWQFDGDQLHRAGHLAAPVLPG